MADVPSQIIKELWYATPDSTWDSLVVGLNEILSYEHIDLHQYQDLEYAVKKVKSLETDFPDSSGELHELLDHYM